MQYRLKIVPDAEPNADGRWIDVTVPHEAPRAGWNNVETFFRKHIPAGEHLVNYEPFGLTSFDDV